MKLARYSKNPILKPTSNWWESKGVFNPGATLYKDQVYLVYRAWGEDNFSRFGLAKSKDGLKFSRSDEPLLEGEGDNPYERLGIEDVRISQIHDTYYLVYTAASVYPTSYVKEYGEWARSLNRPHVPYRVRISLTTTTDFRSWHHHGVLLSDFDSKDAALFPSVIKGYYFLIHRHVPSIWLSFSHNLRHWQRGHEIMRPQENWERLKIGAGSQPLKTDLGWLVFYHGVDSQHVYRLGAVLLDLENPSQVLKRTREPLFEPTQPYEKEGNVSNVVFTCGVVEKEEEYYLYYGAADTTIGLARVGKKEFLSYLSSL